MSRLADCSFSHKLEGPWNHWPFLGREVELLPIPELRAHGREDPIPLSAPPCCPLTGPIGTQGTGATLLLALMAVRPRVLLWLLSPARACWKSAEARAESSSQHQVYCLTPPSHAYLPLSPCVKQAAFRIDTSEHIADWRTQKTCTSSLARMGPFTTLPLMLPNITEASLYSLQCGKSNRTHCRKHRTEVT